MFSELLNECFQKPYREHLLSSRCYRTCLSIPRIRIRVISCGNRLHSSTIAFVNSAIFWHWRITLVHLTPIKFRFRSYQGTWQATEIWQSPLAAWMLFQCELQVYSGLNKCFINLVDWLVFHVNLRNILAISWREHMLI